MSSKNQKLTDVDDFDKRFIYPVYIAVLILSISLVGGSLYRFLEFLVI